MYCVIQLQQNNPRAAAYLLLSVPTSIKAIEKDIRTNVQVMASSSHYLVLLFVLWIYQTVAAMARGISPHSASYLGTQKSNAPAYHIALRLLLSISDIYHNAISVLLRILSNVQRLHRNWQLKNCSLMFLPIQVRSIIENLTW